MPEWVFAYGSNLALEELRKWMAQHRFAEGAVLTAHAARLYGHRLTWRYYSGRRAGGAADLRPLAGAVVHGAALRVSHAGWCALDNKEGYPSVYGRELHPVELEQGGWVHAWVYRVAASHRRRGFVAPRRDYLSLLVEGGKYFGCPREYFAALSHLPTADR